MTHCKVWYEDTLKCSVYKTEKREGFSFQAERKVDTCPLTHDLLFWVALSTYRGTMWNGIQLKKIPPIEHCSCFTESAMMLQKDQLVQEQLGNIFTSAEHSNPKLVWYPLVLRSFCLWLEAFVLPDDNFQACFRDSSPVPEHTVV